MNNQLNLSRILLANGVFCSTSGLIFLLAAKPLSGFLNTVPVVMSVLGIGLIAYGAWVIYTATRRLITNFFSLFVIGADLLWVLFSVLLLILPAFNFSAEAKWAIGITAICVDLFATVQFLEWRKIR